MGWIAAIGERGGVIGPPEEPPGTVVYGPSIGADTVRNGAGPDPVTDPGGGIRITSASNFQNLIDTNGSGTLFVVEAGQTLNRTSALNVGTKQPTIVMLTGSKLVGGGGNFPAITATAGTGYTLRGGTIQNFGTADKVSEQVSATPSGRGAKMDGPTILEDVTITQCTDGIGGTPTGSGTIRLRRCKFHANYMRGISGNFHSWNGTTIFEDCDITANNSALFDKGFDAGGSKLFCNQSAGDTALGKLIVRRNWFHDNRGSGLWCDFYKAQNSQAEIYDNVCELNDTWGLFWEVSYAALIHHNLVRQNQLDPAHATFTFAHLICTSSDGLAGFGAGIEINNNDIDSTTGKYMLIIRNDATRPEDPRGYDVHHNRIWLRNTSALSPGQVGGYDSETPPTMWTEPTLSFHDNLYKVASNATEHWQWDGFRWSWATWSAKWPTDTRELI